MREVGRLQRPLQDGDCVVLGGDIAEALWATGIGAWSETRSRAGKQAGTLSLTYYFSTQGCARGVSDAFFSCLPAPLAAAAFLALRSKKLAILAVDLCVAVWRVRLSQEGGTFLQEDDRAKEVNLAGLRTSIYASQRKGRVGLLCPLHCRDPHILLPAPARLPGPALLLGRFLVLPHLALSPLLKVKSPAPGQTYGYSSANFGKQTSYGIPSRIHHSLRRRLYLNITGF